MNLMQWIKPISLKLYMDISHSRLRAITDHFLKSLTHYLIR